MAEPAQNERNESGYLDMWYVMQTMTGQEENLVSMVKSIVPKELYEDCFTAYYERVWRKQQKSVLHVERLFPGYVFVITDVPEELFPYLRQIPAMSKLLVDGEDTFLSIYQEEEDFISHALGEDHIVHLSYIEKDRGGHICYVTGPLKDYLKQVVRFQYKKRYAIVRLKLLGKEKTVVLGIVLKEDLQQELMHRKTNDQHSVKQNDIPLLFEKGDRVCVIAGAFENMTGVVWKAGKKTVEIGIRMFDQNMTVQIPSEDVRLIENDK